MFGIPHHARHDGRFAAMRGGWGRGGSGWAMGEERGHGRRRRMFDGGELRLVLLALLEASPRHGYDLIREIEERTGGAYAPSPGVVYPALTMLDEMGHVDEVKEEGTRKRFALSAAGRAHLAERRAEADALLARLDALGDDRSRADRAQIGRAIAGLHMALRSAAADADADADRRDAIVAILDQATRAIERGA